MKKIVTLLIALMLVLTSACVTPEEEKKPVESVEFTMSSYNLTPGTYDLLAKCNPSNSDQEITFALQGLVEGVSLTGAKLTVAVSALDGLTFNVVATSVYDPMIRVTKEFSVTNEISEIEISTEADLRSLSESDSALGASYVLTNDIELTEPWVPIGTADHEGDDGTVTPGKYFMGIFDGKGYKISGINYEDTTFNIGFFAQIGATGIVKNTEFEGSITAQGWSGGIAGINLGTIENVIANIAVTVNATSAGAIASVNRGLIRNSIAIAPVVSSLLPSLGRSAGLVAANESSMENVFGDKDTMLTDNFAAFTPTKDQTHMLSTVDMKTVDTFSAFDQEIWSLVSGYYPMLKHEGFIAPEPSLDPIVRITNTILEYDLTTINDFQVEIQTENTTSNHLISYGLVNEVEGVSISDTGLVTFDKSLVANLSNIEVQVSLTGGELVEPIIVKNSFVTRYYPILEGDIITISTAKEFDFYLNGQTKVENLSKTFVLTSDIELEVPWRGVGIAPNEDEAVLGVPFTGIFDGRGFKVSGLDMSGNGYNKAIFLFIGNTGIVKNTHFEGYVEANAWAAGFVLFNYGLVENCIIEVKLYVYTTNSGLLARENTGTIRNILVLGKISNDGVGDLGLFRANSGTLENVLTTAALSGALNLTLSPLVVDDGTHIVSDEDFIKASTYSNFDLTIWNIVDGEIPTLKKS